jgi:hypothetical protein
VQKALPAGVPQFVQNFVAALDVSELVSHHEAELVFGQRVAQAGVEHEDRLIHPRRERVETAWLDVDGRALRDVEDLAAFLDRSIELGEAVLGCAEVAAHQLDPQQPVHAELVEFPDQRLDAGLRLDEPTQGVRPLDTDRLKVGGLRARWRAATDRTTRC